MVSAIAPRLPLAGSETAAVLSWRRGQRPPLEVVSSSPVQASQDPETSSPADEAALLLAIANGDRGDPMRQLYQRYERRLYGLGLRLLSETGLAEELVQETFLRLWRTAARFDPNRGTASAFIYAIARRLAIDLWRRPSSRPFLPESDGGSVVGPEAFDQALTGIVVREALDSLSEAHREVLELSFRNDLTQTEIANRLNLPLGTVKSRAYHALKAFKVAAEERGIHV